MANADTNDSKRRGVATHELLGPQGNKVDRPEEATGIRYTDKTDGWVFEYQIPGAEAGTPLTMLAVFGAKTLATNEASAARQNDESEEDNIRARFDLLNTGTWRERAEGGVGAKIDRDALAEAIVQAKEAAGQPADKAAIRQRLDDEPKYLRMARQVPEVAAIYDQLTGASPKAKPTVDAL